MFLSMRICVLNLRFENDNGSSNTLRFQNGAGDVLTLGEHSLGRLQGVRNTLRVPEKFSRQGVNKEF